MELRRGIVSAPLRPVYSGHGRCCPPSGAFSPPQSSSTVEVRRRCIRRALRPGKQEWVEGWVRRNDTLVRGLPILVGGASLVAVLLNRAVSGIAAVADASRSQSLPPEDVHAAKVPGSLKEMQVAVASEGHDETRKTKALVEMKPNSRIYEEGKMDVKMDKLLDLVQLLVVLCLVIAVLL